jgi:catechol 2,3-dioxygenase-like lactoylglutathione lyase family enzyme
MAEPKTKREDQAIFKDSPAFSTFAVDDLEKAKKFYGKTLGIKIDENSDMGIFTLNISGGTNVMVYPKPDHKPAVFTILNFPVDDIDEAVDSLKSLGIDFEQYDTDDLKTDEKGIMRGNGPSIAWFKDPAGNILSVIEE